MSLTKLIHIVVSLTMLFSVLTDETAAKSVYVISDTGTYQDSESYLRAYEIVDSSLVDQQIQYTMGRHAINITIDERSAYLFVTFETDNIIYIVNAKTMQYVNTVTITGASDLTGIVFDQGKSKVYVVNRYTNCLYSYLWNPTSETLTPDFDDPYYVELQGIEYGWPKGAFGISLDEEIGRLYVADNTNKIKYYDTNNWSKKGEIPVSCNVIGVAVDVNNQLLYYGSMGSYGQGDPHLYQYNITSSSEQSVTVGCSVAGIAVDQQSSLVYLTTYGGDSEVNYPNPPQDRLMIYNSSLVKQPWESGDIGNPAGICVPSSDIYYKPAFPYLTIEKDDNDATCVEPPNSLYYNITYNSNGYSGDGAVITDYLPFEVDYYSSDPCGLYDANKHTVSWDIGSISGTDSNTFQIQVSVNYSARPGGIICNYCEIENNLYRNSAAVDTNVCWYGGDIIYVNKNATGYNTGLSWNDAYRDLQDALQRAWYGFGAEIWVAAATYKPDIYRNYYSTFQLVDSVSLYGGFAGNETSRHQRNWVTNQTILSGDINGDGTGDIQDVVTALGVGQTTIIDGFTITKGLWSGLWCDPNSSPIIANNTFKANWDGVDCNGTPTIINCIVENNACYGIFCLPNSSPTITNSRIWGNSNDGVHCKDSGLAVSNCIIEDNTANGIYDYNAPAAVFANNIIRGNGGNGIFCEEIAEGIEIQIRDNWIHNNGGGIYIDNYSIPPPPAAVIRNNTIVNNAGYGINSLWPEDVNIINCIIWGNNSGQDQLYTEPGHGTFNKLRYSCIQNGDTNNGNINTDPLFYNDPNDPNNFHLSSNSPCIDKGNPYADYSDETDIDGEGRVKDGDANGTEIVDMGADEFYWSPADFNGDRIVNFIDYAEFALAWQSHPGDHEWRPKCDIAVPYNRIDYNDLAVFCEDWLWQSAWDKPAGFMMMGRSAGETESVAFTASEISLQSISAEQQIEKVAPLKIEQLIKWLEQVWLEEETHKLIDEDLWLKFMESLKEDL